MLAVLLVSTLDLHAGGGAWNRKEGGYYIKVGPTFLSADREFGVDGNERDVFDDPTRFRNGSFGITNLGFYGELGLTDWLTGVLSTQYTVAVRQAELFNGRDTSQSSSGLGDTWLDARVRLLPDGGSVVGALNVGMKIPTGSPNQEIPLGTGVIDYQAALAFGTGFPVGGERYGYAQVSAGYRLRKKASDEVHYQVEAGAHVAETLLLQAIIDGIHSTADFDAAAANPDDAIIIGSVASDQSFLRWSLGAIYRVGEDLDLNIGYGHVITGRNTLSAGSLSIGLSWTK